MKNIYPSIKDLENDIKNITNNLSTSIYSFSSKNENNKIIYKVIDDKENKLTINEENIMNYKIYFKL